MNYKEELVDGITVLQIVGRIDSATTPNASDRMNQVLGGAGQTVLLDLSQLDYVSSAGFRVLLLAGKKADDTKGRLALCGMSSKLRQLFNIAGFLDLFAVFEDRQKALESLSGKKS
jgi:anti-anti-sigma factor